MGMMMHRASIRRNERKPDVAECPVVSVPVEEKPKKVEEAMEKPRKRGRRTK